MDLQSVEKYLPVRSHVLLPRKCWKMVFLASKRVGSFLKDLSRAVSRFSGGPDDFFDLIGDCYRILTQLDKKRVDGDFLQLGPWRSTKQFWIHLEENSDSFLGEEDQFATFFGQKLMRPISNISGQKLMRTY